MDQIFTVENRKKTCGIFDDFRGLRVFSMGFCLVYRSIFGSAVTYTLQKPEELSLACLFEVFTGLWLSKPTFCIKDYNYVKLFVRVLVLLVINTVCLKKLQKSGEHRIVDFYDNYAKRQLNVCSGGDLCSPFFINFSEPPCMRVGFDERISLV